MKVTLSLLKQFLELDCSIIKLCDAFNNLGHEVEQIIDQNEIYQKFIVAEIILASKHPEADKLQICKVDTGTEVLQIICGAPNARAGLKTILAPVGTFIPETKVTIKQSKIRGIESNGMLTSSFELGLSSNSQGIIEIPDFVANGTNAIEALGLNEVIIDLAITPNRGDCLGVYGIARDLAASGIAKLKPLHNPNISGAFSSPCKVQIDTKNCSQFYGRYFRNINNKASPDWLQNCLKNLGAKPITAIVDIGNYFTLVYGRPVHFFAAQNMKNITITQLIDDAKFTALNGKEYKLENSDIVVRDDQANILALAGIIGAQNCAVTEDTCDILLEIADFEQNSILQTSRRLQIESDAKYRFERKIDPGFLSDALNLITQMVIEICGGQASEAIIIDNQTKNQKEIYFEYANLSKYLGVSYPEYRVKEILANLGFVISKETKTALALIVPSWRHDIENNLDIVEEIARIDGFNNIPATPFDLQNNNQSLLDNQQRMIYRIKRFVANLGYFECYSYSFINADQAKLFSELKDELFIQNPISNDLNYLRPSIISSLMDFAAKNSKRSQNNCSFYELANIYQGVTIDQQVLSLTGFRCGKNLKANLYQSPREFDFFDLKADLFAILNEIGFDPEKVNFDKNSLPNYYHPAKSAALKIGKNIIGFVGEIHPKIAKFYQLKQPLAFELFLQKIPVVKNKHNRKAFKFFSPFPEVQRDFCFIIDHNFVIEAISRNILAINKELIREVTFFDIYSGNNIEPNKKSVTFNVVIQANDRTLTEAEIEEIYQKIIQVTTDLTKGKLRDS